MIDLRKGDCLEKMKDIPDKSIDLIIIDPPYKIVGGVSGGCFGSDIRKYHNQIRNAGLDLGIQNNVLDELIRIMKKINIYIWCNKTQLRQYIDYFEDKGCTTELICWHKTNPIPTCNNKYLSDTEYLLFFKQKGAKLYGTYATKRKWYLSPINVEDKKLYNHPTIKPLNIIENLIINSSKEGDVILDCYMGSGTTGVASVKLNRNFIGIEIDDIYFDIAQERINNMKKEKEKYERKN